MTIAKNKIIFHTGLISFVTALALLVYFGCGSSGGDDVDEENPNAALNPPIKNSPVKVKTTLKCPRGTSYTYENFGEAFMLSYCTSCHSSALSESLRAGAPTQINLDRYEDIVLWRISINNVATGRRLVTIPSEKPSGDGKEDEEEKQVERKVRASMPPAENVPDIDRSRLSEWLGCGSPGAAGQIVNP